RPQRLQDRVGRNRASVPENPLPHHLRVSLDEVDPTAPRVLREVPCPGVPPARQGLHVRGAPVDAGVIQVLQVHLRPPLPSTCRCPCYPPRGPSMWGSPW